MTLNGIDVSNLQGASFDWASYAGKIQFAFIKVSEGTGFTDVDAPRNAAMAKSLGIVRGFYHFLRPEAPGGAQAQFFLRLAKAAGMGPGDLMMIDSEVADGKTPAQIAACAVEFANTVHASEGAWPVAYTDQVMAENGSCAGLGNCPAFIANPSHVNLPNPIGPWHLVSFEQTGQKGVDVDVFYGTLAELGKLAIPHPAAPPKPPAVAHTTKAQVEAWLAEGIKLAAGLPD